MRKTMAKVGALRTLAAAVKDLAQPGSPGVSERLAALPRMVAAVRSGRYRGVGMGRLGLIAAGVAYVVSPVDVVPEGLLLVAGLADDLDVGAVGQRVADAAADQRVVVDDQVAVAPACVFPAGHGACMRPPRPLL